MVGYSVCTLLDVGVGLADEFCGVLCRATILLWVRPSLRTRADPRQQENLSGHSSLEGLVVFLRSS